MPSYLILMLLVVLMGMHIFALRAEAYFTTEEKQSELLKRQSWAGRPLAIGWTLFNLTIFYALAVAPLLKQWIGWQTPLWLDRYGGWFFLLLCLLLMSVYGIWHFRRLIDRNGRKHWAYHVSFLLPAVIPLATMIYFGLNPPR